MPFTFSADVRIDATLDRVFSALTDLESAPRWMTGLVRVERLTEGDFGLGTEFCETRKMFGKEATEHFEVTAFEPERLLRLRVDGSKGTTGKGEYLFTYALEPEGTQTHLLMQGEIKAPGLLAKMFGPLFVVMMKKAWGKDLQTLKDVLEGSLASRPSSSPAALKLT